MSSPVNEVKPSEVVQLKRSRDAMCKVVVELQEQIKTLKAENEELKSLKQAEINQAVISDEGIAKLIMDIGNLIGVITKKDEEIEKLKAENEKLKEEINGDTFWGLNQGLKKKEYNLITQQKRMVQDMVKLKADNEKQKEEIEELKFNIHANNIEAEFIGHNPNSYMKKFNEYLENRHPDIYEKLYDYFDMDDYLEEEEGLQVVMFEGKEYYVDTSDGDNDVYDTSHEIVGSWDGKKIIFKEDKFDKTR